ncbi:hypothetical protein EMIHUDRAFT_454415, partial [Emiliania huxleyi CCMP1516]|uniref:Subtilisin n=2 Tax=Emiliania huxleyi TaxID=2903 RepID=A0A0D3KVU6_EMIH1
MTVTTTRAAAHEPAEQPKDEIGASEFIRKYPSYDGRGIIVGVFDTGVDPGAPGLQTTSDGKPKMIDLVDCTGSGDVDTSKETELEADGTLKGLSGRSLTVPAEWPDRAAGTKYRLGLKRAFELYPRPLVARVKAERRRRHDETQRAVAEEERRKAALGPPLTAEGEAGLDASADQFRSPARRPLPTAEGEAGRKGAELAARVSALDACDKAYEDGGPVYDVLTYKDESGVWRVCVDTSERGALGEAALLAPFRVEGKYGTLDAADAASGAETLCNFAVEVAADGARTTLCVDAGSHGTHVAGIIGAHFPDTPELNGIATVAAALADIQYTWSSRGPTYDGHLNVSVSAPGGAIAPVPNWTLQGRQLMNGTSMASPNACGGITLLLSALAARGERWSPASIRRAIETTALRTPNATGSAVEVWALGRGLLQVGAALSWLEEHGGHAHCDVRFELSATTHGCSTAAGAGARGVYLREPQHSSASEVGVDVFVRPRLHEEAPNAQRVSLDVGVTLQPSAPWLSCAPFLALTHGGKGFNLKVSPGQLPPGAHYAEVAGHDSSSPRRGPLFSLPVTVCRPHANLAAPHAPCHVAFERVAFSPGHIERRFVVPPRGATWATLTLRARGAPRSREPAGSVVYMYSLTQLLPQKHIGQSSETRRVTMGVPDEAQGAGAPATEYVSTVACV